MIRSRGDQDDIQVHAKYYFRSKSAMIHLLLNVISPESQWTKRLYELIKSHPFIKSTRMGLSANWQDEAFWEVKLA